MFFNSAKIIKKISDVLERIATGKKAQNYSSISFNSKSSDLIKLEQSINIIKDRISSLEKEKLHMQAILSSMVEGVIVLDSNLRIISINPTAERILAVSSEAVAGKFFLESIRNNEISEIISSVLRDAKFVSREVSFLFPTEKIFQINVSPIFENKEVTGCLVVIHDITEIRKLEVVRRDFVANVSHELKTPLTSIQGFVETLLEGALEDKGNSRHFLEIIETHTERLNKLINDLLDLSYLESNEIELSESEFDLSEMVAQIIQGFHHRLKENNITIENKIQLNLYIRADKNKIEQVLVNLIDNAIKFNKIGGAIYIYSTESSKEITVFVKDSGFGIPAKDLSRIFERFYRVDKARSRELGGTGLGLSIVKHIIELHSGKVGVESIEGEGSKFWFTLPK